MGSNEGQARKILWIDDAVRLQRKFACLLDEHGNQQLTVSMPLSHWCIINGLVMLALDHPGIQDLSDETPKVAEAFREAHKAMLILCGFTEEEAERFLNLREGD